MTQEVADEIEKRDFDMGDVGAVGGTMAGNALSLAAARATLGEVLTDDAFRRMNAMADRFAARVKSVISDRSLPWHVVQIGSRLEYRFRPEPPRNATEAFAAADPELDAYLHVFLLNRGVLMTPFHNMALISPATEEWMIERHSDVLASAVDALRV